MRAFVVILFSFLVNMIVLVASAEMLLYGGLIASRISNDTEVFVVLLFGFICTQRVGNHKPWSLYNLACRLTPTYCCAFSPLLFFWCLLAFSQNFIVIDRCNEACIMAGKLTKNTHKYESIRVVCGIMRVPQLFNTHHLHTKHFNLYLDSKSGDAYTFIQRRFRRTMVLGWLWFWFIPILFLFSKVSEVFVNRD